MPNTRYGKEFHSTGAAYEKVLPPRVGRNETGGGTNKSSLLDLRLWALTIRPKFPKFSKRGQMVRKFPGKSSRKFGNC